MNRLLCRYVACSLVCLFLCCLPTLAAEDEMVIVVHPDVADTLKKDEIKQIFLGKKTQWSDNSGVTFVLLDDNDTLNAFLKTYIGKSPDQFKNYWKKQVFTGKGKMPKAFDSPAELMKFLSENHGSISFMRSEDVDKALVNVISFQP